MNCVFCKIFSGEIPSNEVARTDDVLVFRDLNPQAPHHLLVIPKRHAANLGDFVAEADLCVRWSPLVGQVDRVN